MTVRAARRSGEVLQPHAKAIHNPNHNPNPNPSPKQSNSCLTSLSRDQNSFLPITLQGSIFTLRHEGCFGISVQKYTDIDHFHTLRAFSQEFSLNLGERFSRSEIGEMRYCKCTSPRCDELTSSIIIKFHTIIN